MDFIDKFYQKI